MKVYVLSDVHLEFYVNNYKCVSSFIKSHPNADEDILCLCGDIGDPGSKEYKMFLMDCYNTFRKTFLINGNHECYGRSLDSTQSIIAHVCDTINKDSPKIHYLSNGTFDLDDHMTIIGSTLWSSIDQQYQYNIRECLNDFKYIRDWSLKKQNLEFEKNKLFIQKQLQIATDRNKKTIIMTHHAPSWRCGNPIHENSVLCSAFKNKLDDFIAGNTKSIFLWCYGHDHYSMKFNISNTILFSNQVGYPNERVVSEYEYVEYIEYTKP